MADVSFPVLSMWQPYASLFCLGVKANETRSSPFPAKHKDAPIIVQAALRWTKDEEDFCSLPELNRELYKHAGTLNGLHWQGVAIAQQAGLPLPKFVQVPILPEFSQEPLSVYLPLGALVGSVVLNSWKATADLPITELEDLLGDYSQGRFAWFAHSRKQLPPIAYKGKQGWGIVRPQEAWGEKWREL